MSVISDLLGWTLLATAAATTVSSNPPSSDGFVIGWFDGLVILLMILLFFQGRRRGMSGELLDLVQWMLIIVVGGLTNETLGRFFAQISGLSLFWSYIVVYLGFALLVKIIFTLFKKSIGEKLVGSGVFGPLEYYLGMFAGVLRALLIALFILALLNARKVTDSELQAQIKSQVKELGKVYFPPLGSIQISVFQDSFIGSLVKQNLPMLLIASTEPAAKKENPASRRQREIDELLGK